MRQSLGSLGNFSTVLVSLRCAKALSFMKKIVPVIIFVLLVILSSSYQRNLVFFLPKDWRATQYFYTVNSLEPLESQNSINPDFLKWHENVKKNLDPSLRNGESDLFMFHMVGYYLFSLLLGFYLGIKKTTGKASFLSVLISRPIAGAAFISPTRIVTNIYFPNYYYYYTSSEFSLLFLPFSAILLTELVRRATKKLIP